MVTAVVVSWEQGIKKIRNWPEITGELFLRKIFELDPETITMFGFPADTKYDDPSLASDPIFMGKAVRLIKAIDMAVGFLGPDLQPLEYELFQLGARHAAMQCRPHQWSMLGEALFYVFEQCMRGGFTKSVRTSWTTIYNFLGYHMIRGLLDKCPRLADPQAKIIGPATTRPAPASPRKPAKKTFAFKLDCSKKTPLSAITYDKVQLVLSSWDTGIRRIPNWATITGESFLRHIFRRAPETISMFGFPADLKWDDLELKNDRRFIMKGVRLIKAIDMAVSFLGPDLRPLEQQLFEVGERHVALNCRPSQWPTVGEALFDVFEECMEEGEFTQELRNAWTLMYNFWGYHMILGLVHKCPELANT
jgi:hemoglobin-like flavoprotein